jgi:hypothetical protein
MKKQFLMMLAIAGILLSGRIHAQDTNSVVTLPTVTVTSIYKVNNEVDRAFRKSFPDAKHLRWYRLNKDYLAKFIKQDMKHHTLFQKNGYIKYDISYGLAHDLTSDVGDQVHSAYNGYNITNVAKVVRYDQSFWIINLEGIKDFVVVRAESGELQEVRRIEKTEPQGQ